MRRADREVKELNIIEEILNKCKTCHLALNDSNFPYIVPLSYGHQFEGGVLTLFFHCAFEGKKIDILKVDPNVCFEMSSEGDPVHTETPCNSGYYYESIIGNGKVVFVDNIAEKCNALAHIMFQQSGQNAVFSKEQANTVCVFKIVTREFTGKKKERPE